MKLSGYVSDLSEYEPKSPLDYYYYDNCWSPSVLKQIRTWGSEKPWQLFWCRMAEIDGSSVLVATSLVLNVEAAPFIFKVLKNLLYLLKYIREDETRGIEFLELLCDIPSGRRGFFFFFFLSKGFLVKFWNEISVAVVSKQIKINKSLARMCENKKVLLNQKPVIHYIIRINCYV